MIAGVKIHLIASIIDGIDFHEHFDTSNKLYFILRRDILHTPKIVYQSISVTIIQLVY